MLDRGVVPGDTGLVNFDAGHLADDDVGAWMYRYCRARVQGQVFSHRVQARTSFNKAANPMG